MTREERKKTKQQKCDGSWLICGKAEFVIMKNDIAVILSKY